MLTSNANESIHTLGSSVEPVFYKLQVPGGDEELGKCALAVLREIEKNGGSAAFEAWLKESNNGGKKLPLPDYVQQALATGQPTSFTPHNSYDKVAVTIYSAVAYTYINVDIVGTGVGGSGGAWGLGLGAMWGVGVLKTSGNQGIRAWSKKVAFFGIAGEGGVVGGAMVEFYSNWGIIGQILVAGSGLIGAVGFGGEFRFR